MKPMRAKIDSRPIEVLCVVSHRGLSYYIVSIDSQAPHAFSYTEVTDLFENVPAAPVAIPWDEQTFPRNELVWVRHKFIRRACLITGACPGAAFFGRDGIAWDDLFKYYQRLLPDGSIVPCGVVP